MKLAMEQLADYQLHWYHDRTRRVTRVVVRDPLFNAACFIEVPEPGLASDAGLKLLELDIADAVAKLDALWWVT